MPLCLCLESQGLRSPLPPPLPPCVHLQASALEPERAFCDITCKQLIPSADALLYAITPRLLCVTTPCTHLTRLRNHATAYVKSSMLTTAELYILAGVKIASYLVPLRASMVVSVTQAVQVV